ncbi:MucBP domain-containing protein, partial [Paenibacillus dokdonensis]|uniref:MucBP domain-containing protein n=1 Tax=Paenibacillus dokdonensis TaxID=2567944 RepID=UPI003CCC7918
MKRGYKLILSWLCIVALFTGLIPGGFFVNSASAAASGEIVWPNPGATNLKKIAEPVEGKKGQWKVTLTVEGKNIKTASDVVLVIDRSGSMDNSKRMDNAKTAAQKFVDNLLLKDSTTKIAVVTFDKTADVKSELVGVDKKADLTKVIKNITVSNEGTNIQAGLNKARTMLEKSSAQNKVVVLLSDGAPTYSYKASNAAAYTWPSNKYSFTLSEFSYNKVLGSGGDFGLEYWSGFTYKNETYTVNKFKVQDNGIAALSEAKLARDGGIGIYSIGLEVGNDDNAKYVLNNVQNKGYYSSNSGDLSKVFNELSGQISYAAQNAVVTDPMGAMFNKVNEPAISQGTIEWDSKTETFTWKVGNVMEGSPATLTYNVELDPKQTIDSNTAYPTNGDTILKYDDINGKKTTKYFEVPKVSFGKGSILVKGYRVNNDGQPINEDGVVVDKPEQAQELVKGYYFKDKSNNESLDINKSYDVAAPSVDSYELKVGTDPTKVSLTIGNPTPTVWFGYVQAVEQQVNVKYLEKGTNKELSSATMEKGIKGKQVQLTAKTIQGYTAEKSSDKYTFTTDKDQTYTFYYTANEQTVTVKYLEKGTNKEVSPATTAKGGTGKEVDLKAANVAGYTPEKSEAKYTFTAESGQVYTFYYTANEYKVTVKYQDESGKDVAPAQDLKGKAGDKLDVTAVEVEGYAPVKSSDVYTVTNKDNQQYVFTYKVKTYPVTVKFQDESGKELATAVKMEGAAGAKLNVTAANVEGYTPNQSSDVYTVTKEANQQYVFTYKVKTYSVVVKFQDAKGNKLAEPITLKGAAGEKLDVTAANVEDYTPDKDSDVYTVTKAANQEYVFTYTVKTYPVVVKFQDAKGNKLADPITLKGAAGEKLDVTAANVEGYTPNKDSDVYTVTKAANQEYVFTYTVKTYPVVVKFQDAKGNKLADPITLKGAAGEKLDVTAANVEGYTPDKDSDVYTVTKDANQQYVFTYTVKTYPVLVKFVDEEGKELATAVLLEGTAGEKLNVTAAEVEGYTPNKQTDVYEVTNKGNQLYVFTYTLTTYPVIVKFQDAEGNKLADPITLEGTVGQELDVTAATVEGYTPDKDSDVYTVTKEADQEYVFTYMVKTYPVLVKFVDEEGKELATAVLLEGTAGEKLNVTAAEVEGYTPNKQTDVYEVTNKGNQLYVFTYTLTTYPVIVKFQDAEGNKLADPITLEGTVGQELDVTAATVEGYTPDKDSDVYTVTKEADQEYVFTYMVKTYPVLVKFVDEEGKELATAVLLEGTAGEKLNVTAAEVEGYTPDKQTDVYEVTNNSNQLYVFTYTLTTYPVIVKFQDAEGNKLADPITLEGTAG